MKSAGRTSDELRKAKDCLRAAAWRCQQDQRRRPEAAVVAMALLKALCTVENQEQVDGRSAGILTAALLDLHDRGFSIAEVNAVMRRLRKRWLQEKAKVQAESLR